MFLSLLKNTFFAFVAQYFSLTTQFKLKDSRAFVVGKIYEPLQNFHHHHHRCHFHHNDMLAELWSTIAKCITLSIFCLIIITRNHFLIVIVIMNCTGCSRTRSLSLCTTAIQLSRPEQNHSSCLESFVDKKLPKNCSQKGPKKGKICNKNKATQSTKANQSSCLESVVNKKICQRIANKKAKKGKICNKNKMQLSRPEQNHSRCLESLVNKRIAKELLSKRPKTQGKLR